MMREILGVQDRNANFMDGMARAMASFNVDADENCVLQCPV
jgi:hypothetical protein